MRPLIFLCLLSFNAHAMMYEGRLQVGVQQVQPDQFNEGWSDGLKFKQVLPFGADLLLLPESTAFGLGLRYENLAWKAISSSDYVDLNARRAAVLVNWRHKTASHYFGAVASWGFWHTAQADVKIGSTTPTAYNSEGVQSASLGGEAAVVYMNILVGAEIGYQLYKTGEFVDSSGNRLKTSAGVPKQAELNGPYAKFILGVQF